MTLPVISFIIENKSSIINAQNKDLLTPLPITKILVLPDSVPQHREIVSYYENGKTKESITEHDSVTGMSKTITSYYDGEAIESIMEFDPTTGKKTALTCFNLDGKTEKSAIKFKEDGTIVFAEDVEEDKTIMPNPNN